MLTFGIIDDRKDARESFRIKVELALDDLDSGSDVEILDIPPFPEMQDFVQWILENEIAFLIVDERLYEEKMTDGKHAKYSGHDLVIFLRNTFKDLPIYGVTNYKRTEELNNSFKYFNLILGKDEFDEKINEYLNMFIRSGRHFYKEYKTELNKLSELSQKIALGKATKQEVEEAHSLQTKLAIPHGTDLINDRELWLKEFSQRIAKLDELSSDIDEFLKNQ